MQKLVKASIAAGAAAVLLLGGAGTLALWQDDATVDAGTVSTGTLALDAAAAGSWSDTSPDAATTVFDPATDSIVPGDTLVFAQTVVITADGKNLQGALSVGNLDAAIPATLSDDVTVTVAATPTDPLLSVAGNVVSFAAPGEYQVPITITVAFAAGTPGSTPDTTMAQELDLTALALTLNQVRP